MSEDKNIIAAPSMYIDIVVNGQKHIYDVQSARQLRDALNSALSAADDLNTEDKKPNAPPKKKRVARTKRK